MTEDFFSSVTKYGKVQLHELSKKQIIGLLNFWSLSSTKKDSTSFSDMFKRCYKTENWDENSSILYILKDCKSATEIKHAFNDLYSFEEEEIMYYLFEKK